MQKTNRATVCAVVVCAFASMVRAETSNGPSFARDIQPILAKHCFECHGPDVAKAGLKLNIEDQAIATLKSGLRAIVPGDAARSHLIDRITTDDESERMPPEREPLKASDVELLKQWINAGAEYESHWAYQPIVDPKLPVINDDSFVRNAIDHFVVARLQQRNIQPSAEADRATLIKRLYFDLIGLPPTPKEVDAFINDKSTNAYDALVDQLLQSKHFGERWGRHWLDKARYADSDGYEKDRPRMNAWRYRDWVVDAVNKDMPFDQFTIEQLAGDLLPNATNDQKLATAFHRQTLTNTEGGTDREQFRVEATFDRTETTASIWMGLTMACARCHSHKYDQISQQEYYELYAFFNDSNETNINVPTSQDALDRYNVAKSKHDAKVAELDAKYKAAVKALQPKIDEWDKQMQVTLADAAEPLSFTPIKMLQSSSKGGAKLEEQKDQSVLVTGDRPDKDDYTLIAEAPSSPVTGLKIETLTHASLKAKGPGRADNGNYVLSHVRVELSDTRDFKKVMEVEFASAEADFSQRNFDAHKVLTTDPKTGWAISNQMGRNHHITLYAKQPVRTDSMKFLRVTMIQQYGGTHTIGRFRVSTMAGSDPLKSLPKAVADALRVARDKRKPPQQAAIANHVASMDTKTSKLLEQLNNTKKAAPKSPVMSVRTIGAATRNTRILHRGDFLQPGDPVKTGGSGLSIVSKLHPIAPRQADKRADRLDLANWLIDPDHPITSRVIVNHVWSKLFGKGLVGTLDDFGIRGKLPTHPKVLDWLAWNFARDMKWSRKQLIRTIVTSATYRQSSNHRPELVEVDPTNQLLARQNRVRVEGEIIRDLFLATSGLLSRKIGGPCVYPPLPAGVTNLSYANSFKWSTSQGDDRYRRGMYTFFKRTAPHPNLMTFDCPDSNTTRLGREISNTPLQALITLNNDVFLEAAQAMVNRVFAEGGDSETDRLAYAIRLCISRQPKADEVTRFHKLLDAARTHYRSNEADTKAVTGRHAVEGTDPVENAAWVATLRMILNLDEFIVRG